MKWIIEAIKEQLNCDDASAQRVWEEMDESLGADVRFSELTSRQLRAYINRYSYAAPDEATRRAARHAAEFSFKR
jgi:hypothetical protein